MKESFHRFAHRAADVVGSPAAFMMGLVVIAIWAITGPVFDYSDTWQLVINTGTTIITFLMVFLIQNTQNRDSRAVHLKLDELIRSVQTARDEMVGLEDLSDEDLDALQHEFTRLREHANANCTRSRSTGAGAASLRGLRRRKRLMVASSNEQN